MDGQVVLAVLLYGISVVLLLDGEVYVTKDRGGDKQRFKTYHGIV